tara:strand:- start:1824 stop:2441 length:618 start_codon:yes stop_codon:yes gene_type:complete
MIKKTYMLILLIFVTLVSAEEYSLDGEAREELNKQINSWLSVTAGVAGVKDEQLTKLEVGVGSWINEYYGLSGLIQLMPGQYNGVLYDKQYTLDIRSLSVQGEYLLWGNGFVEINIPHRATMGLAKIYTRLSEDDIVNRSEGFLAVGLGLGVDFPISESFELSIKGDYTYVPYLDESKELMIKDLNKPSIQIGFRWYPNVISEVK